MWTNLNLMTIAWSSSSNWVLIKREMTYPWFQHVYSLYWYPVTSYGTSGEKLHLWRSFYFLLWPVCFMVHKYQAYVKETFRSYAIPTLKTHTTGQSEIFTPMPNCFLKTRVNYKISGWLVRNSVQPYISHFYYAKSVVSFTIRIQNKG